MNIISIDPGVESGYCYAEVSDAGQLWYYPFQAVDDVDELWRRLHKFEPRYIIMESFEFRNSPRGNTGVNLFPRELIGVARLYELTSPTQCALHLQTPAQGKSYYTDATLKAKNLWVRGKPHAMDASRHLLQWLTFGSGYQFTQDNKAEAILLERWDT